MRRTAQSLHNIFGLEESLLRRCKAELIVSAASELSFVELINDGEFVLDCRARTYGTFSVGAYVK